MNPRPSLFYGWWVVAAASVGLSLSTGAMVVLTFGLFLKPLVHDFQAGRGAVSFAFTLHNFVGALCVPFAGRLIDRFGARKLILSGTTFFGLTLISSELLGSRIVWLYFFYASLGILGVATTPVPYGVVVARWFDRRRGLALGLMALGLGLGATFIPIIAQPLIATWGWRTAYACFGCATLLIAVPIVAAFLEEDPQRRGLGTDGSVPVQRSEHDDRHQLGLSWQEIWHDPKFWCLIVAFFLAGGSLFGCIVHLPALLTDRKVSDQVAAHATSIVGFALLIGRVSAGYLLDRFFAPSLAMLFFGGAASGIALLWAGAAGDLALLAAFLLGLGIGAEVDIIVYLISRYFGLRSLGTAFGFGFASYALAGALSISLMGAVFDLRHSYSLMLGMFVFAMLVAMTLMTRLGPYRYGTQQHEDIPRIAGAEPAIEA